MALQDDFIIRRTRDLAKILARLVLGKAVIEYQLPKENAFTAMDSLYQKLTAMADEGHINEAENLLLEEEEPGSLEFFEAAAAFYLHLNDYEDEFLEEHQYSREEVLDGLKGLGEDYGVDLGGMETWI